MFDKLLWIMRRKSTAPEKTEKEEMMEGINRHEEGGQQIMHGLDRLKLSDLTNSLENALIALNPSKVSNNICEEKLALYRNIVSGLQKELDNAELSDMDTSVIDPLIAELLTYFENAVRRGDEASADKLLVNISDGIQYIRVPFRETTKERRNAELKSREEQMETIVAIAELRDVSDQIEESIRDIETSIEKMKAELEIVKQDAKEFVDSREDARELLRIYKDTGDMPDKVFITQFAKYQNRVIHARSDLDKLTIIREHKEINKDKIDRVGKLIKIADYMKEQPITQEALTRATTILDRSKDAVAYDQAQKKIIDEMERKAEAIFDVMEENMLPEIDQIISEYEKMERADRKAVDAIETERARRVEEDKVKEKEVNKQQEPTLITV